MKTILFDFDGVLVDTFSICFSLSSECNENLSLEDYRSFFNGNIYNTKRSDGRPIGYRSDFHEKYEIHTRELKVPDELKKLLKNLSSKYTLAIVSSTPTRLIKDILNREDLVSCFTDIYGSDLHRSKVIKIKILLEKYKTLPNNAVFITDTAGDIIEARECDVRSVAVTWGYQKKENLLKEKPLAVVETPKALEEKIEEFFR